MQVTIELVENFPLPDTSHGRSPGLHISDLIRCQAQESGLLAMDYLEDLSLVSKKDLNTLPIGTLLRIHFGLAWERYYIPQLENVDDHPGEKCVDKIFMSPDGFEITSFVVNRKTVWYTHVHEVKCTSKSTNTVRALDNVGKKSPFMWLAQLKSYCKAANSRRATLHVLFLYGNYKRPFDPVLAKYHIIFTQKEIDDNWNQMLDYREYRMDFEVNSQLYLPADLSSWMGVEEDDTDNAETTSLV